MNSLIISKMYINHNVLQKILSKITNLHTFINFSKLNKKYIPYIESVIQNMDVCDFCLMVYDHVYDHNFDLQFLEIIIEGIIFLHFLEDRHNDCLDSLCRDKSFKNQYLDYDIDGKEYSDFNNYNDSLSQSIIARHEIHKRKCFGKFNKIIEDRYQNMFENYEDDSLYIGINFCDKFQQCSDIIDEFDKFKFDRIEVYHNYYGKTGFKNMSNIMLYKNKNITIKDIMDCINLSVKSRSGWALYYEYKRCKISINENILYIKLYFHYIHVDPESTN